MHYSLSGAVSSVLPYFLLILYTIYLNPTEFGKLSLVMSVVFLTSTICSFGAGEFNRREISKNWALVPLLFRRITAISTVIFFALASILLTASYLGFGLFKLSGIAIASGLLIGYGRTIFTLILIPVQMSGRSHIHALLSISMTVAVTSATVIFLVLLSFGWKSRVVGELGAYFFILAALLSNLSVLFNSNSSAKELSNAVYSRFSYQQILRSSMPIGLALFINSGYVVVDRMLLSYYFDFSQVGLYAFNLQFAAVFGLVLAIMKASFIPVIYKHLGEENRKEVVSIMTKIGITFVVFVPVIYASFHLLANQGLLGSYVLSSSFTLWVISTAAVNNFSILCMAVLFYMQKARVLLFLQIASFAVNFAASIILIEYYGAIAIAIGSFLASIVLLLGILIYGRKSLAN